MRLRELVAGQLAEERDELRAVYHFFCGAGQREMCLSGFLRFCDAFSLSPGYLGPDKVEEIFENCAGAAGPPRPRTRALCGLGAFEEALCLAALAVAEKQWLVEYSAEKRARFQYRLADAEKSRPERGLPDSLGELLQAMQLDQPRRWRARAAGAVATGPHASPAKAPSPQTKPRASPPRSIEERLHALRTALGVDDPNASGGGARARGRSPRRTNGDGRPGTPATGAAPAAHTPRPPPRPRVVSPREGMVPHPPDQRPPTPVAGPTQPPPARGGGGGGGGGGAPVTPRSSTRSPRRHRVVEGSGAPAPKSRSQRKVVKIVALTEGSTRYESSRHACRWRIASRRGSCALPPSAARAAYEAPTSAATPSGASVEKSSCAKNETRPNEHETPSHVSGSRLTKLSAA